MITISYTTDRLAVEGHSEADHRTCHAVSLVLATLCEEYGAPLFEFREEPQVSLFAWENPGDNEGLRFALAAFRLLAESYPSEVSFDVDSGAL